MADLRKAAALFEDRVDRDDYFHAAAAERARRTLHELVESPERRLLFLLGEPGVGKTKMLRTLQEDLQSKGGRDVLFFTEPFFDPRAFLERLLKEEGLPAEGSLEECKTRAVERYGEKPHLIMIDEAQLLNETSLEFLRILADTRAFTFLLSMHRKEGEEILSLPHFRSRSHRVVEIGALEPSEVGEYLRSRLREEGMEELADSLDGKSVRAIHRYTEGNFRLVKRMAQTLFELMDEAKAKGMTRFARPDGCLTEMAALDLELIDG